MNSMEHDTEKGRGKYILCCRRVGPFESRKMDDSTMYFTLVPTGWKKGQNEFITNSSHLFFYLYSMWTGFSSHNQIIHGALFEKSEKFKIFSLILHQKFGKLVWLIFCQYNVNPDIIRRCLSDSIRGCVPWSMCLSVCLSE